MTVVNLDRTVNITCTLGSLSSTRLAPSLFLMNFSLIRAILLINLGGIKIGKILENAENQTRYSWVYELEPTLCAMSPHSCCWLYTCDRVNSQVLFGDQHCLNFFNNHFSIRLLLKLRMHTYREKNYPKKFSVSTDPRSFLVQGTEASIMKIKFLLEYE